MKGVVNFDLKKGTLKGAHLRLKWRASKREKRKEPPYYRGSSMGDEKNPSISRIEVGERASFTEKWGRHAIK